MYICICIYIYTYKYTNIGVYIYKHGQGGFRVDITIYGNSVGLSCLWSKECRDTWLLSRPLKVHAVPLLRVQKRPLYSIVQY